MPQTNKTTIYYALAIMFFLKGSSNECLLDDVVNDFQIVGKDGLLPYKLLSNRRALEEAMYILKEIGAIELDEDDYAPPLLARKGNLEELVNHFDADDISIINRFLKAGSRQRDWLIGALSNLPARDSTDQDDNGSTFGETEENAAEFEGEDSDWEPLPLDRGTPDALDALEKTEAAVREIEQNNGYASSQPDERNGIVEVMRGTLNAMKEGSPSKNAILTGLMAPLRFIAKKFSEASMGEAAKLAVAALVRWLFS